MRWPKRRDFLVIGKADIRGRAKALALFFVIHDTLFSFNKATVDKDVRLENSQYLRTA